VEKSAESARFALPGLVQTGLRTIAKVAMIIACPACGTRYAVPDSAIGSEGRTVRCAKCKHSWFQEPPELELDSPVDSPEPSPATGPAPEPDATPAPETAPEDAAPAPEPATQAGPSINRWRTGDTPGVPAKEEPEATIAMRALRRGMSQQGRDEQPAEPAPAPAAPATPLAGGAAPAFVEPDPPFAEDGGDEDDEVSQFDYRAPFTRRRNTLQMWTIAAAIFAVLAAGTAFAVNYYGLPDWAPFNRPTFGIGKPGLELDFPREEQRSETLENGEKIFRVRGTISNTSRETLAVPNLLVVFSDPRERKVGDWVVVPAKRELAPGETVNVTEAIANIPPGAAVADLGWAPG
jgi:predicted Zn finger-like uncharacterized protein